MTDAEAVAATGGDDTDWEHVAIRARVGAGRRKVMRVLTADWLCRSTYNAAVDRRRPFADGIRHAMACDAARRAGLTRPERSPPSPTYLPPPDADASRKALTRLRREFTVLATVPATMLGNAVDEACRARSRHLADCVAEKAAAAAGKGSGERGKARFPTLRFRLASDGVKVATSNARTLRVGDGQTRRARQRKPGPGTERNRERRADWKVRRSADLALRDWRAGHDQGHVIRRAHDRARDERERDARRRAAEAAEAAAARDLVGPVRPRPRRDSPDALTGERRCKVDVQGVGRLDWSLSRPVPAGAEVVAYHYAKGAGRRHALEGRMVVRFPRRRPLLDPAATGAALHAALADVPADAPAMAVLAAAREVGVRVRGEDINSARPSVDDAGHATRPTRLSTADIRKLAAAQRELAHKDRWRRANAAAAGDGNPVPHPVPKDTKPDDAEAGARVRKRAMRRRRSGNAVKVAAQVSRTLARLAGKARTRAAQDVNRLLKVRPEGDTRTRAELDLVPEGWLQAVATDTHDLTRLLRKGGPAGRRKAREKGEVLQAPAVALRDDGSVLRLSAKHQRAMRANMGRVLPARRIRMVAAVAARVGILHLMPGMAGTTRACPGCGLVRRKPLGQRRHECEGCGLGMDRDRAAAVVTAGRGLAPFRASPDPGGAIALAAAKAAEERRDRADAAARRRARSARRWTKPAAAVSVKDAMAASDLTEQGVPPLCPPPPHGDAHGVPGFGEAPAPAGGRGTEHQPDRGRDESPGQGSN